MKTIFEKKQAGEGTFVMADSSTLQRGEQEDWDLVIRPKSRLLDLNIRELIHYRDLIGLLVRRDLAGTYKQTILGWLWFIVQPLFMTFIYTFVFGGIAKIGTDTIPSPLFYFGGTILWTYFSQNLLKCSDTFNANSGLFSKIYFPRLTMPLSYIATSALSLGVQFIALAVFYAYYLVTGYHFEPTLWLIAVPFLVLQLGVLGTGIGITISALTTKYRDLKQLLGFGISLWMYATPIVYPLSQVPAKWRWVFVVNPVSPVIETFRFALFGRGNPDILGLGWSVVATILFFVLGLSVFRYSERTFVDVV
jgi:lipopolysaccharide transport system permease protein